tara:strand:+ start:4084 stop:4416 length:333 start_codon:yes stop_codon:yes gene_type:complete
MCIINISCNVYKREVSLTIVNNSNVVIDSLFNINSSGTHKFYEKIKPNDSLVLSFSNKTEKGGRFLNSVIFYANGKSYESVWGNITGYRSEMINRILITDESMERFEIKN